MLNEKLYTLQEGLEEIIQELRNTLPALHEDLLEKDSSGLNFIPVDSAEGFIDACDVMPARGSGVDKLYVYNRVASLAQALDGVDALDRFVTAAVGTARTFTQLMDQEARICSGGFGLIDVNCQVSVVATVDGKLLQEARMVILARVVGAHKACTPQSLRPRL